MNDIIKQLKNTLTHTYQKSLPMIEKSLENKGYTRGLKQALDILDSFQREWETSGRSHTLPDQTIAQDDQGIHQLSAQQVCKLKLTLADEENTTPYAKEELIEAAFRFENELLSTFGDANTVPIETYETLDEQKLIHIIVMATEKIVQLQHG